MVPYQTSSFDYAVPPGKNDREEVIFSLTERLRERESEIRRLHHEKSELENQILLRGNPIKLDVAYEELLAHLKRREEEFRSESKKQEERRYSLEREVRKLKEKVHDSRKLLDEQERNISRIENETEDDLEIMHQQLHAAMRENHEKDRQIAMLEAMVENLTAEVDRAKEREDKDKVLISRLDERVEAYRHDQEDLEEANEELQKRVDTLRHLLKEKEDGILEMEKFRDQREDELNDDLEQMRRQYDEIVAAHQESLEEREEEIRLLYGQCDKYDDIIDEAKYVTHEQRVDLQAKRKEIEDLSLTIERVQSRGLLGQLDKMCGSEGLMIKK